MATKHQEKPVKNTKEQFPAYSATFWQICKVFSQRKIWPFFAIFPYILVSLSLSLSPVVLRSFFRFRPCSPSASSLTLSSLFSFLTKLKIRLCFQCPTLSRTARKWKGSQKFPRNYFSLLLGVNKHWTR